MPQTSKLMMSNKNPLSANENTYWNFTGLQTCNCTYLHTTGNSPNFHTMKTSLLLVTLLMVTAFCRAQCPSNKGQWEFTAGYGVVPSNEVSGSSDNKSSVLTAHGGVLYASGRYFLYNRMALGLYYGMNTEKGENRDAFTNTTVTATYTRQFTTFAIELYYIYFFRKRLEAYTLLGVGPGFASTTTTTVATSLEPAVSKTESHDAFRAQYSPIGIRVGGRLGLFAEFGYGYKGMVSGGISFKFGRPCWWKPYK